MTEYISYGVNLSEGQKDKLGNAYERGCALTLRLKHSELTGNHYLRLTKREIERIEKALIRGVGVDIRIPKTRIRKVIQEGGSLWSTLFSLGSRLLPSAGKALATGALGALGSLGIDKLFRGKKQKGGFMIPQSKIDQLIKYKSMLTRKQKEEILQALQTGGDVVIRPTKAQKGGFLGTLLASIGIPLVMKLLTGKGLQTDNRQPRRSVPVYVPPNSSATKKKGGLHLPLPYRWQPPPFIGSWGEQIGRGKKKDLQQ